MKAVIALTDGTIYEGNSFGATGTTWGEVVFNTGMTGYQEILTDPSYAGQIVTLTYPLVGNYGTAGEFTESDSPKVRGFIVREAFARGSRFEVRDSSKDEGLGLDIQGSNKDTDLEVYIRGREALGRYLKQNSIIAVEGIDTRKLTRKIRQYGVMKKAWPEVESLDLVKEVTTKKAYIRTGGLGPNIALLDLGVKKDIVESLARRGCRVTVFPADTPAEKILSKDFDGVLLSNGPGDPRRAVYAINTTRKLLGKIPVFGICLGHQILALALGGSTYKLKFGHRGANHPVKDIKRDRVFMTSQNHGYAVEGASLEGKADVTFINANDGTVEGLEVPKAAAFSVQFHPEASPGPTDAAYLFDEFLEMIKCSKNKEDLVQVGFRPI